MRSLTAVPAHVAVVWTEGRCSPHLYSSHRSKEFTDTHRTVYLFFVRGCFGADLEYTGSPLQYPSPAAVDG